MADARMLAVGEVTKPHGVRGEVRVFPLTDDPSRFKKLRRVIIEDDKGRLTYEVESVKLLDKMVIVKFRGIDDMDSANALRGRTLLIPESERVRLPKDRFFVYELIGVDVVKEDGGFVGKITDVLPNPCNDIYVVCGDDGEHLIPAVREIVREVDLDARRIVVRWIEGL